MNTPLYYAIKNKHWDIVRLFIHILKLDQLNSEDKALIIKHQKEIAWSYYLSVYSSTSGETSPIISMLKQSTSIFNRLEKAVLEEEQNALIATTVKQFYNASNQTNNFFQRPRVKELKSSIGETKKRSSFCNIL